MRKSYVAQVFNRHDTGQRLADKRKHLSGAGVKQQWLIVGDEVLIEREATGSRDGQWCVYSINAFGNFMHVCAGLAIRNRHQTLLKAVDSGSIGHPSPHVSVERFLCTLQSNLNIQK